MSDWQVLGVCFIALCITIVVLGYLNAEYEERKRNEFLQQQYLDHLRPKQTLRQTDIEWIDKVTSNL